VGKILTQFRHVSSDLKASFEREMQNLERETEAAKLKELGASTIQTIQEKAAAEFEYPYYDSSSSESYDYVSAINPPVGASEVSGAESQIESAHTQTIDVVAETTETESPEGTVPRGSHQESPEEATQHS
jgi:hypothetical protein